MSITKNRQSHETLCALASIAFPDKVVKSITELTEGMFNAAYRIDFEDGASSILKIAAATTQGMLSNEINMMQAEVAAMKLAREHHLPYVAQVQYSDFTRKHCDGSWFLMETMPGRSVNSCRSELSEDVLDAVMREVGRFQRQTATLHGSRFGLLGDENHFESLYDFICYLFGNVLRDASARTINIGFPPERLLARLKQDRAVFDEVTAPSFVHWDMWEGNIFVQDGQLSGIIDWERAMWADPYMDDRFRCHTRPKAFLEGFGQTEFSANEMRRMQWYDLFLFITMYVECFYRQYDNNTAFVSWIKSMLDASWKVLE